MSSLAPAVGQIAVLVVDPPELLERVHTHLRDTLAAHEVSA